MGIVNPLVIDVDEFADEAVADFTHCFTGECRVGVLPILFQISQIIMESEDLVASLAVIFKVMQERLRIQRGMMTLFDYRSETNFVHESFGLSEEQAAADVYSLERGLPAKVIETGKAAIIPPRRVAADQTDREEFAQSGAATNLTYFGVPIIHARKVLGTITAERVYHNRRLLKQDVQLLTTIAAMIAPAVDLYLMENVEKVRLENENNRLKGELKAKFKPSNIIGNAKVMKSVYDLIYKVASTKATVLILGESGVGKELVASAIHYNSPNSTGPFIKFNCAALPEGLVESELFGHEKGAFTGATGPRAGRFEQANGGTIFLDEVGELSLPVQAKLLRILQERNFERVGGNKPVKVDIRIIAATNRNLLELIDKGQFREDLYYRLNVFPMTIPPLRERGSDAVLLAEHFAAQYGKQIGKEITCISTPALNMLLAYSWPGNVRELENVIERSVILSEDGVIHGYNLPPSLQTPGEAGGGFGAGLDARLAAVEYEMIVEALKTHRGNMTETAKELNLTRRVLGLRMDRHNISYRAFRRGERVEREAAE
jgi:Nif-specific regulatory protein